MEYTGITFGLDVLISLIFGAVGALGVWFKLKGNVNIQAIEIDSLSEHMREIKEDHKEDKASLHKRIDSQKLLIDKNRENSDTGMTTINLNMNAMELRIIKAIHDMKT